MDLAQVLMDVRDLSFVLLAAIVSWQWLRQRSRPAAYLAAAFVAIAVTLLANRLLPEAPTGVLGLVRQASILTLALFPWLLTAFAWSFEGPLPDWLRRSLVPFAPLAVWLLLLPPIPGSDQPRTPGQQAFAVTFIVVWLVLVTVAITRLWRAGTRQRLVRARMRLLAGGAVLATAVLVVSAVAGPRQAPQVGVATAVVAVGAAVLFLLGLRPPSPLRHWWRRTLTREQQRMQVALIAALTPRDVAAAVTPVLADLVGGGVTVLDAGGAVLASSHEDEPERLARRLIDGEPLPAAISVHRVAESWLLVRTTPYTPVFGLDEHGLVEGFSLQMRLALERARLFEAQQHARRHAERAHAELESTLVGLAHDLKSPTLAISGFTQLLAQSRDRPEAHAQMVDRIASSSAYLGQLVDAMVDVSRIGKDEADAEPVDLSRTTRLVAERLTATSPHADISIDHPLPALLLSPVRAEQMLDNLLRNAVEHAGREDVHVRVDAREDGDQLVLRVADDGQGVTAQDRDRIFRLFQRGRGAASTGSGVGLGVVRRLAESYGGGLTLVDTEVGAAFDLRLPTALRVREVGLDGDGP